MSIEQKTTPVDQPETQIRRTFRTVLERSGADHSICFDREIVPMLRGEIVKGGSEFRVARKFSDVKNEQTLLAGGVILTVAQVAEAIANFADKWDSEDHKL